MIKLGIVGNPISHSRSNIVYYYFFSYLEINYIFYRVKIKEDRFYKSLISIFKKNISRLNITIPFKKTVFNLCNFIGRKYYKVRVLNLVFVKFNIIIGNNTDMKGFIKSFKLPLSYKILVVGFGGVAYIIINYIINILGLNCFVWNRTNDKIPKFLNGICLLKSLNGKYDIIINCTPSTLFGYFPLKYIRISTYGYFYDINYTKCYYFNHDINFINGINMLYIQAIYSFKIFFKDEYKKRSNKIS